MELKGFCPRLSLQLTDSSGIGETGRKNFYSQAQTLLMSASLAAQREKRACPNNRKTIWLAMKFTAFLILAGCLVAGAKGHSQTVTLSAKDASLETVFQAIQKQTGYHFLYNDAWLTQTKKVTIQLRNASLKEALDLCFKDQPFTYTIVEQTVVVKQKEKNADGNKEVNLGVLNASPPIDIKGRIVNEKGEPVLASIQVKGTRLGTSTNNDGYFELKEVDDNATLIISATNIETREVKLNGRSDLDVVSVVMKVTSLNELVINKGYYTEKQKYAVGNVGKVTARDIEKQPVNNPLLALQGRVSGLYITQSTGVAGGGIKVRIQGQNSLNSGNDPLFVIDGVPYVSQGMPSFSDVGGIMGDNGNTAPDASGGANPLSFINPADIESIEILKDADATSIYGSRASAGAILITTKKGKPGTTNVNVNVQNGWGKVAHFMDLLNTQQYLEVRREGYKNDGVPVPTTSSTPTATNYDFTVWDQNRYTDWQKTLLGGTAHYFDAQSSFSGGNSNTQFLIGLGYHRETSVFPTDMSDQKYSLHFNISHTSANRRLQIQFSGNYLIGNNNLVSKDMTQTAIRMPPTAPALYNPDGSLNWALLPDGTSTWNNPLSYFLNRFDRETNNLLSNLSLSYKIVSNLTFKSSFGYTNLGTDEVMTSPLAARLPDLRATASRLGFYGSGNIHSWIAEPQLQYEKAIGKTKLEALVGSTFLEKNSSSQQILGSGYNSDLVIKDINSAASISVYSPTVASVYKYNALFARLNFNVSDKYVVNLTARRDGSSRFGSENLFHNFGSVGAAWLFSNENFIRESLPFVSHGKLKASIGTTGNDQIGDYRFMNLYYPVGVQVPFQGANGLMPVGVSNPYLQWEETKKIQGGIELGFVQDRVLLDVTYYHNRSSNQLQPYALPILTGNSSVQINFPATVQNAGWEFTLNTMNLNKGGFSWRSNFNLTLATNKLIAYQDLAKSNFANRYVIGQPINIGKGYKLVGVDPQTGIFQFQKADGTLTSTDLNPVKDRTVLTNFSPQLYGGFENSFQFKGIELSVLFQFVKQMAPNYDLGLQPGRIIMDVFSGNVVGNQPTTVLNRWQKPGDNAFFQKFSASYPATLRTPYNNAQSSDVAISDVSFIRLKNASLSWQIPAGWKQAAHLQNARIYVQGQNLLTFTKFKGMDPEAASILNLPPLRVITVGVQVGL